MGFDSPDFILSQLNLAMHAKLKRTYSDVKDGMDMAICIINRQTNTLEYAGAKIPLYLIQEGEDGKPQLTEIKANRKSIGDLKEDETYLFDKQTFDISRPTTFYLSTDGYKDQFGGEQDTKFLVSRFRELLLHICDKPMPQQQYEVEETIVKWLGNRKQIDDMLVIGAKI
jgi:serine phosphatase RsbU (regulator of sigma subunit)